MSAPSTGPLEGRDASEALDAIEDALSLGTTVTAHDPTGIRDRAWAALSALRSLPHAEPEPSGPGALVDLANWKRITEYVESRGYSIMPAVTTSTSAMIAVASPEPVGDSPVGSPGDFVQIMHDIGWCNAMEHYSTAEQKPDGPALARSREEAASRARVEGRLNEIRRENAEPVGEPGEAVAYRYRLTPPGREPTHWIYRDVGADLPDVSVGEWEVEPLYAAALSRSPGAETDGEPWNVEQLRHPDTVDRDGLLAEDEAHAKWLFQFFNQTPDMGSWAELLVAIQCHRRMLAAPTEDREPESQEDGHET